MTRTEMRVAWMLASACALLAASCESTTRVGSECRHGVCPQANAATSRACLVSSTAAEIGVTRTADDVPTSPESPWLGHVCLPREIPIDSRGHVACRVLWRIGEGEESSFGMDDAGNMVPVAPPWAGTCSDLPFLMPAGPEHPPNACLVTQITADEAAAGEADGWFWNTEMDADVCPNPRVGVAFTRGANPPSGVVLDVACSRVQAAGSDGELVDVDASECSEPPAGDVSDLGAACLPATAPAEFDDLEAYVETPSQQCATGACLVFRLRGSADPECQPCEKPADLQCVDDGGVRFCAAKEQIPKRAYCSCRCDAPAGDPGPRCDCADGFTCIEVLEDGPPGIRGSYCLRDGTFTLPQ